MRREGHKVYLEDGDILGCKQRRFILEVELPTFRRVVKHDDGKWYWHYCFLHESREKAKIVKVIKEVKE